MSEFHKDNPQTSFQVKKRTVHNTKNTFTSKNRRNHIVPELVKSSKEKKFPSNHEYKIPIQTSIAVNIPPEIFIKICEYLPPTALLSLSHVCRQFRGFLYSTTSSLSQKIWATSRIHFLMTLPLPPPSEMDEISYIKLALLERGCQFCTRKSKPKVYWVFLVRCCRKCLKQKTLTEKGDDNQKNLSRYIPKLFALCLPYETVEGVHYYWAKDFYDAKLEYDKKTTKSEKEAFLHTLAQKKDEQMEDASDRMLAEKKGFAEEIKESKRKLLQLIQQMCQEVREDGNPKYTAKDLAKCPSYIKASCSLDMPTDLYLLKQVIADEYHKVSVESEKLRRQKEVLHLIATLRASLKEMHQYELSILSQTDPPMIPDPKTQNYANHAKEIIYQMTGKRTTTIDIPLFSKYAKHLAECEKHLRFCPSYHSLQVSNLEWNEHYILKTLIPQLCKEASQIEQHQPCFTVRKALAQGWYAQRVFKCRLCTNRKLFDYSGIKQHLQSIRHSIQTIEEDKMIKLHLMHGIMSDGPRSFWLAHLPIPNITDPTDVICKVKISGLCSTDTQLSKSGFGSLDKRTVMGHQFVAKICDKGLEVKNLKIGDLVLCPPRTSCGKCYYCKRGMTYHCERGQLFGWTANGKRFDGGQAEYVRVPFAEASLVKIPQGITEKEALLLADFIPVGYFCAENGLNLLSREERETCVLVVTGCTPVGLAAIASAIFLGVRNVFAIERNPKRLAIARRFGATPIDQSKDDPFVTIKLATDGRGADVALATDYETSAELSLSVLRPAGVLSIATMNCQPLKEIKVCEQDVTVISKHCPVSKIIPKAIPLVISKRFDFESIITHTLPLRDAEEGYKLVGKNTECITAAFLVADQYPEVNIGWQ